jgi:hypothetical protein
MRYWFSIFLFAFFHSGAFAQADSSVAYVKNGFCINATELINLYREPDIRLFFEHRFGGSKFALYLAPGMYLSGSGYNVALGLKKYRSSGAYVAFEGFYKYHNYIFQTIGYDSMQPSTEHGIQFPIIIQAWSLNIFWGATTHIGKSKHFYLDAYGGFGLRHKNIQWLTYQDDKSIEMWIDHFTMMPDIWLYPTFKAGVNIGYNFSRVSR